MKFSKRFILCFVIFLTSCVNSSSQIESASYLPDSEIVYYLQLTEGPKNGFINSDGTNRKEMSIHFKKGFLFDENWIKYDAIINSPPFAWNRKLRLLGLVKNSSIRVGAGFPVIIDEQGRVFECPDRLSPWTTRKFTIIDNQKIIIIDEKDLSNEKLILFNMHTCQKEKTLYSAEKGEEILYFSIASDNRIAISLVQINSDPEIYKIKIFSQDLMNYETMNNASGLTWSVNGKRFFYYDKSIHEFFICENFNNTCKSIKFNQYNISWSTDGNWLIAEYGGKIYRINIVDNSVIYIVDGLDPLSSN